MTNEAIRLVWSSDGANRTRDVTTSQYVVLGRHEDCDIILDNPRVSRRHAIIYFDDGFFRLYNMSKTNPIVVNSHWRLNCEQSVPLRPGDDFQIGDINISIPHNEEMKGFLQPRQYLRVRCFDCGHLVDYQLKACPWCGATLAGAESVLLPSSKSKDGRSSSKNSKPPKETR